MKMALSAGLVLVFVFYFLTRHISCDLCGAKLTRRHSKWKLEGKKHHICHACNSNLERRRGSTERQLKLDIAECTWRSMKWGKDPCDHLELDGKRFSLEKGMKYKGRYIFPGEEDGCQCMSTPVIEGFIE